MNGPGTHPNPIDRLADEFLESYRRGENPSVEDFVTRYPEWADDIRQVFPALLVIEQLRPAPEVSTGPRPGDLTAANLKQLGDYRILHEIGRGGMGIVYEAEQISLGRHVALKVLPAQALLDERYLARFRREAKAAGRLHHTNIVPVYGVGEDHGLHYYVMQYIPGMGLDHVMAELRNLRIGKPFCPVLCDQPTRHFPPPDMPVAELARSLLTVRIVARRDEVIGQEVAGIPGPPLAAARGGPAQAGNGSTAPPPPRTSATTIPFDPDRPYWHNVALIGIQVADALAYAHGQGVLHRDIKPSNLLLDARGTVWVTDFGLAKAADESGLTQSGDVVGTLAYMPPERFNGHSDARGDLYSLGLTLYELLTLQPAFDEPDRTLLLQRVMRAEPLAPRKLDSSIPHDLETIILKAVQREPDHRYQAAAELAEDLRRFVEDRPILARRFSARERLWRWAKRNPVLAGLGSTVAILLVVMAISGVVAALVFGRLANQERESAEAARQAEMRAVAARDQAQKAEDAAKQEAQRANEEAETARKVSEFLSGLFEEADPISLLGLGNRGFGFQKRTNPNMTVREALDRGVETLKTELRDKPLVRSKLLAKIGGVYLSLGLPNQAEPLITEALALSEQALGPDHPDLAASLQNISLLRFMRGRDREAVDLGRRALAIREKQFGPDHPLVAETLLNLSLPHMRIQGDTEADALLERAVAIRRKQFGDQSREVAVALLFVTQYRFGKDKQVEAIAAITEAVRILQGLEDQRDLVKLLSTFLQGQMAAQLGNRSKAIELYLDALGQARRLLGDDNFVTLMGRVELALTYYKGNDFARAEREFRDLLAPCRLWFGSESEHMAKLLLLLDRCQERLGRPDGRIEMLQEALTISQGLASLNPQYLTYCHQTLAGFQAAQGRFDEAEQNYRAALAIYRKQHGEAHASVLHCMQRVTNILFEKGDREAAERALIEELTCYRLRGGVEDVQAARRLHDQGRRQLGDSDPAAALPALLESCRAWEKLTRANSGSLLSKYHLVRVNLDLCRAQATHGHAKEASETWARAGDLIGQLPWSTAAQRYEMARLQATASTVPNPKTPALGFKEQAEGRRFADHAVASLRGATVVGYRDITRLEKDPDLDCLRERQDFRQLLDGLGGHATKAVRE